MLALVVEEVSEEIWLRIQTIFVQEAIIRLEQLTIDLSHCCVLAEDESLPSSRDVILPGVNSIFIKSSFKS